MSAALPLDHVSLDASSSPAERDTTTMLGLWIYIITDCVLFAALFATYAVLRGSTAGGPSIGAVSNPPYVLAETVVLLCSSFACGIGWIAAAAGRRRQSALLFGLVFVLGAAFIGLECWDLGGLVQAGDGWSRSAALSSYFTLVGTHALHVLGGMVWLVVMLGRLWREELAPAATRRFALFSIFWHFLDIVWIFIFTVVYLLGAAGL